ncbi:hypothetical protein SLE2022_304670 [Rubroshorea leprosula]
MSVVEGQDVNRNHELMGSKFFKRNLTRSGKCHTHHRRRHHHHHHHSHHRRKSLTTKNGPVSVITSSDGSMVKYRRQLVKFFSKVVRAVIPKCDGRRSSMEFQILQRKKIDNFENEPGPAQFDFELEADFVLPIVNRHLLPPLATDKKRTIVLDLDETLVHSRPDPPPKSYDFVVRPEIEGHTVPMYVLKRPGMDEFLKEISEKFEVVVFTAGLKQYAALVLDNLDPEGRIFNHRLYRESCKEARGRYVKDLSELGRDLRNVVIVDDNPKSYTLQPENAIPIKAFVNDLEDRELEKISGFFRRCGVFRDMREAVKQYLSRGRAAEMEITKANDFASNRWLKSIREPSDEFPTRDQH